MSHLIWNYTVYLLILLFNSISNFAVLFFRNCVTPLFSQWTPLQFNMGGFTSETEFKVEGFTSETEFKLEGVTSEKLNLKWKGLPQILNLKWKGLPQQLNLKWKG